MTYAQQLGQLTTLALEQGVPPAEIIQALELVKLEVAFTLIESARAEAHAADGPKIHIPN